MHLKYEIVVVDGWMDNLCIVCWWLLGIYHEAGVQKRWVHGTQYQYEW